MIPSAFENVKRLPDDQLAQIIRSARNGDMTAIEALNLTSATPVLAEMMRRNRVREMIQQNAAPGTPNPKTVLDQQLAKADQGVGSLEIPGMMEERTFAGGGIVSFQGGGQAGFIEPPIEGNRQTLYTPEYYEGASPSAPQEGGGLRELSPEEIAKLTPQQRRAYFDERTRQRYAAARAALGPAPAEMTPEEQRRVYEENIELARKTSEPYLKRMRELLEQSRPDQAKMEQDAAKRAVNMGLMSLIGAKRMPGQRRIDSLMSNINEALRTGTKKYGEDVDKIDRLKREYVSSELKLLEAENAAARGDMRTAQDLAKQASADKKTVASLYRTSVRGLDAREKEELDNNLNQTVAEIRAAQQQEATAARERSSDARTEAILKKALARSEGGGPRQMTEGQRLNTILRVARDIKENRRDTVRRLERDYGKGTEEFDRALFALAAEQVDSMTGGGGSAPRPSAAPGASTRTEYNMDLGGTMSRSSK